MARVYVRTVAADVSSLGDVSETALTWNAAGDRVVGVAWQFVGVISLGGVFDLGDPSDPVLWATVLSNQEASRLASAFDQPTSVGSNPFRSGSAGGNMTYAEVFYWLRDSSMEPLVCLTSSPGFLRELVLAPEGEYSAARLLAVSRGLV